MRECRVALKSIQFPSLFARLLLLEASGLGEMKTTYRKKQACKEDCERYVERKSLLTLKQFSKKFILEKRRKLLHIMNF